MIVPNRRLPAKEQAEDAVRRSEAAGKPIDVRRFSAEAYGWFVHPPRDENCPPPKIGYAGRRRRPPKDYKPPQDGEWVGEGARISFRYRYKFWLWAGDASA
jgi:hypothetical protein